MNLFSRKNSRYLALLILGLFFTLTFFLNSRKATAPKSDSTTLSQEKENEAIAPKTAASAAEESDVFLKNFQRRQTRDGKLLWEVTGKNARMYSQDDRITIESGEFLFIGDKGQEIELFCDEATLYLKASELSEAQLVGNVLLIYDSGTKIRAKRAKYLAAENLITAPGLVHIENKNLLITGERLRANTLSEEAHLERNVTSTLYPKGVKDA